MGIILYKHNLQAYQSLKQVLEQSGRACVVHPTGTGKSYIGFKLCEDYPDKKFCWLSPSEYIYRTQIENLNKDHGYEKGDDPFSNIHFCTYAKLSYLSKADLAAIAPDYIILDEFHRCGAEVWGTGVQRLLAMYPDAKLVGLSATAIRYLDNQRDMADELFDGNVASEMTLGEAIVKGILNPPRYVLSMYSYKESLDRYGERVNKLRYKGQKDKAQRYLDALKRTLEKAEGLDLLFDKYMTDRTGKYIIFCSNHEAMQEAIGKTDEWFGRIDAKPHVYSVYSDDADASASFEAFKSDDDKNHLKLLFCIDALNEGVHVEDVSGVILLRPTVSPIIYKQQIGRTLSASKSKMPVIFDIVGNIEGLYSIDAVKEEMEAAINYMRWNDGDGEIVNETFEVLGELKNCLELFGELEGLLSSSWDVMYLEARKYYEEHGNLVMPLNYINDEGYPIGRWVHTQRMNRKKGDACLTTSRISKLDAIGMDWKLADERSWLKGITKATQFYEENGHLDIPATYRTEDGFMLGNWYRHIKNKYQEGRLEAGYIDRLEQIGMKWDSVYERRWMECYEQAKIYYEVNGNLNVPVDYLTDMDGSGVGKVDAGKSSADNVDDGSASVDKVDDGKASVDKTDVGKLSTDYLDVGQSGNNGSGDGKTEMIESGMEKNDVDKKSINKPVRLGVWVASQRDNYSKKRLSNEQIQMLEQIGMIWDCFDSKWENAFKFAAEYAENFGDINSVPDSYRPDGFKLLGWIRTQRSRHNSGKLADERSKRLEEIGLIWSPQEALWECGYEHALNYFKEKGNLDVPPHYVCDDGYKLKSWLINQGTRYKTGRMSGEQKERLEAIGMKFAKPKERMVG